MYKINFFDKLSFILVILGAINWGTIGLLKFNLFKFIVGGSPILQRMIYIFVFIAALDLIYLLVKCKFYNTID